MQSYILEFIPIEGLVKLITSYIPGCNICGDTRNIIELTSEYHKGNIYNPYEGKIQKIKIKQDDGDNLCDLLKKFIIPGVKTEYIICAFHFNERYNDDYVQKCNRESECVGLRLFFQTH